MNLLKKAAMVMFIVFLLIPTAAFAQKNSDVNFSNIRSSKELSEELTFGPSPEMQGSKKKHYAGKFASISSTDPNDYPLIKSGGEIGFLSDSYDTLHYVVFDRIEDISSKDMSLRLLYASSDDYYKDNIVDLEFFKESKGVLTISGFTQFDTLFYDVVTLSSTLPKSEFKDQKYIYVRLGLSEGDYDDYYSDVTTFKVSNPFYIAPDKTPLPAVPTVNAVSDKDKKITGKSEAGSKITVKAGTKVIGSATADKNGKFTVTLKSIQKAGTALYVTATNKAGKVSKAKKMIVIDKTPPAAPKVNKVTITSKTVTGKAEANSTVSVKINKKVVGSAKADKKGNYSVKIKKQKANTILYVYAKDKAGNVSKGTKAIVKKK
ncbi:Ig-like domain-containing protein [Lederbergia citrea]|uniref:Ig-like domain-containing protein n=1 Tax=Lederbergia citrea TaxID=2833581 RepID=UPI001BC9CA3D|nr:Ig-like domain-containing protein [Lederbergia citrea]MBS4205022.1 hypothetical protein [Lederbergia citrea]